MVELKCPCGREGEDKKYKEFLRIDGKKESIYSVRCSWCSNLLFSRQKVIEAKAN